MESEKKSEKKETKKAKGYDVTFRQNRRFELYVGREMFTFDPNERSMTLPEDIVEHPDFIKVEEMFTVKEAKL